MNCFEDKIVSFKPSHLSLAEILLIYKVKSYTEVKL